jgi:hypothetical protein
MDIGSELRVIEVEEIDLDVSLPAVEASDEAAPREQIPEDV